LDYELSLQAPPTKPTKPEPKYTIHFLDAEPSAEQREQMRRNDRLLYTVKRNELISHSHTTRDGFVRSVRHIDLEIANDQRDQIGDDASNIAVFVPNDMSIVERAMGRLQVDPDLVFTIAPKASTKVSNGAAAVRRPFDTIASVQDALTWSLDLVSTPRPSFLRHLAAYATDDDEAQALLTPNALETIQAERYALLIYPIQ
jgi:sulfite reductase alpha subunit-like flavoprotein